MPAEPFELRTRRGVVSVATAAVERTSDVVRYGRAAVICVIGVVLGACTLVIPMVHFFAPWGLPLLSAGLAAYTLSLRGNIHSVEGPCPACSRTVVLGAQGALSSEPIWILCPHCKEPLALAPPTAG